MLRDQTAPDAACSLIRATSLSLEDQASGGSLLQCMQHCHGLLRLIDRDKQMVMVNACDYVAADSRLPQCAGERSGQTHRGKIRVDGEGDPGSDECNRQLQVIRILFGQDDRKPFRLADRGNETALIKRTAWRLSLIHI